jgi:hypothetical protein
MKLTITIECDNAAFGESDGEHTPESVGAEVGRILRGLGRKLEGGIEAGDSGHLRDCNGNQVGDWEVSA